MSRIIFIDLEASALHHSYPVEVGWCSHDLARGWTALIRPTEAWRECMFWDWNAENVHGVTEAVLDVHGLDVMDVTARLNRDLVGLDVISDSPGYDGGWLQLLYDEALATPTFKLPRSGGVCADGLMATAACRAGISAPAIEQLRLDMATAAGLIPHRALDDAIFNALQLTAVSVLDGGGESLRVELVNRARALLHSAEHGDLRQKILPRSGERFGGTEDW